MKWYEIKNIDKILSPALAIYPDRIVKNIDRMIEIAGSVDRLRPHVKTYKMPQIVHMQMDKAIKKFKCATIAELNMLIDAGVKDILLAMPCVGPSQDKLIQIISNHPHIHISTLVDDKGQIRLWVNKLNGKNIRLNLYIDINVGMSRTGIKASDALPLIKEIEFNSVFNMKGLHVYDGHIRIVDPSERQYKTDHGYEAVKNLLAQHGETDQWEIVCGGSVTFPCHARDQRRTLSPGTTLLWDYGYGSMFPDIPMLNAAVLVTRVISKPGTDRICLDLGHKSVGSEMKDKRVQLLDIAEYKRVGHSEEHLILKMSNRNDYEVGDVLYGLPWHICPTVALHDRVMVISENEMIDTWKVAARHREYLTV